MTVRVGPLASLVDNFDFLRNCFSWYLCPSKYFWHKIDKQYRSWLERAHSNTVTLFQSEQVVAEIGQMQLAAKQEEEEVQKS